MPNRDAILLETVKTHRARLASAFVYGELTERRLANDNVRRIIGSVVAAAVLCAGCVAFAFVSSLLGRQAATAREQAGLGPATGPVFLADTFGRRITGGWGTAERGGRWTTSGRASDYSVSDGTARMVLDGGETRSAVLAGTLEERSDVTVTVRRASVRDGTVLVTVVPRRVSSTQDYEADVALRSDGAVALSMLRRAEPSASGDQPVQSLSPIVILPGPEPSADQPPPEVSVRVQAVGTSPTTLRAKAWLGESEPDAWTVTATDDTAGLQRPGAFGLAAARNGSGSAGLVVTDVVGRVAP